jgi:hypothetical protein
MTFRVGGASGIAVTARRLRRSVEVMSTTPEPDAFAAEWIAAWNAHDLDRILSHYAADAVVRTPVAAARVPKDSRG